MLRLGRIDFCCIGTPVVKNDHVCDVFWEMIRWRQRTLQRLPRCAYCMDHRITVPTSSRTLPLIKPGPPRSAFWLRLRRLKSDIFFDLRFAGHPAGWGFQLYIIFDGTAIGQDRVAVEPS